MVKNKKMKFGNIEFDEGAFDTDDFSEDNAMNFANEIFFGHSVGNSLTPKCDCKKPTIIYKHRITWIRCRPHWVLYDLCKVCKKQITWEF